MTTHDLPRAGPVRDTESRWAASTGILPAADIQASTPLLSLLF
jgi:hypothetical protein